MYEKLWDQLVTQKAVLASAIEKISNDKLVNSLTQKDPGCTAAFLKKVVASEVRTAAIKIHCDYRSIGTTDDIDLVATAAGSSVATDIIKHPPPTNLG